MKKVLLLIMLTFSMTLSANEIVVLVAPGDDAGDGAKFQLKSKNTTCVGWTSSNESIISTTCIKTKNSICTEDMSVCKTPKEIFNFIISTM
jgi:hypothetical protein